MTKTGAEAQPAYEERADTFVENLQANWRTIALMAGAVVAIALSFLFYSRWSEGKAERADQALGRAEQSLAAGNAPLAQTDLQRVVKVYGGTLAADQAALLLAQLQYDAGKYQDGATGLESYLANRSGSPFQAAGLALVAGGYEELARPADAARLYQKAADVARFPTEKAEYLADEARALTTAGNAPAAEALWRRIAAEPKGPASSEARVRLGELEAQAAK
ncbi:MAG: hypothetical protein NVS4B3_26460 [Gemmatimonadaceae bacterium]